VTLDVWDDTNGGITSSKGSNGSSSDNPAAARVCSWAATLSESKVLPAVPFFNILYVL
jgi:hypothetical protein